MKVAIIGSNGQLGTDLVKAFRESGEVVPLTHKEIDVTDPATFSLIRSEKPDVIINTAAFHKTDQCEVEPLWAFNVNSVGARNIAALSTELGSAVVFISTDYVFSGTKGYPYDERDAPSPINTYGVSKLAGELFTRLNPKSYVVRVASLFGSAGASGKGGNFVETMLSKARKGEPISVIADMWMSPTYTRDAAAAIRAIVEKQIPFGTYHVTNQGACSWLEFTKEIFRIMGMDVTVTPIRASQFPTKATRPVFSALESAYLAGHGISMPTWKWALKSYLEEKGYIGIH